MITQRLGVFESAFIVRVGGALIALVPILIYSGGNYVSGGVCPGTRGALAFLVHSFFDTHFYSLQLSALFWFMVGVLVAMDNMLNREVSCDMKLA